MLVMFAAIIWQQRTIMGQQASIKKQNANIGRYSARIIQSNEMIIVLQDQAWRQHNNIPTALPPLGEKGSR